MLAMHAANAAATAMNAVIVARSVAANVAMVARAATVLDQTKPRVKTRSVKPLLRTPTPRALKATLATRKAVPRVAKAAATVAATVAAVTSAVHARKAQSKPAQPKARRPSWALSIPSQPTMRKTLQKLQHPLKVVTTTASRAKSAHATVTDVIAPRVENAMNALTCHARKQMQPLQPSRHYNQSQSAPRLLRQL